MPTPKQKIIDQPVIKQPSLDKKFRESSASMGPVVPFERSDTPYDDALDIVLDARENKNESEIER